MSTFKPLAMIALIAAAAPAFAEEMSSVKSIDVTADLTAVNNATAAAYWGTLESDLESALAIRLAGRIAEEGIEISIDIEEVSLSNGFTESLGLGETRLVGDIGVVDETDTKHNQFYILTIDVNQATMVMPEGTDVTILPADTRVYYDAMIAAFADAVVRDLR